MKNLLIGKNLWDIIDGTTMQPNLEDETYAKLNKKWVSNNAKIMTWINNLVDG